MIGRGSKRQMMSRLNTLSERNRLLVTAVGSMFWTVVLVWALPGFSVAHAAILTAWIGIGSHYYKRSFVDFERKLRPIILMSLVLMAPGWPIAYWCSGRGSNG